MTGIENFFLKLATRQDQPALYYGSQELSYAELLRRATDWEDRLARLGIGQGNVVGLVGDYWPDVVACLLALLRLNAIAVPFSEGLDAEIEMLSELAQVEYLISFQPAGAPDIRETGRICRHELVKGLQKDTSPGLIVFTSGSTGEPKAILHDFARLITKFDRPRTAYRTVLFLLFDHLGGINTLLSVLAYGGVCVVAERRTPEKVAEAIEGARAELLPTTPAFLTMLITSGVTQSFDLSSLRLVTYGTDMMPPRTLEALVREFPQVRFQQTYGLSEVGVLRSKSKDSGSLLMKVGGEGFETKVVDGKLWIRSQSAMLGYLNAPNPFDDAGWLNTGDLVEIDGDDLRILGRESDLINVGGQKVFPTEVENVLLRAPNVLDATVFAEAHPILGKVVAARVRLGSAETLLELRSRLRKFCLEHLAPFKVPARFIIEAGQSHTGRFKKLRRAIEEKQSSIG